MTVDTKSQIDTRKQRARKNRYSIDEYRKRCDFRRRMGKYAEDIDNFGLFSRLSRCEDRSFATDALTGSLIKSELTGKPFFRSEYCKHRLCPWCAAHRSKDWRKRVLDKINLVKRDKPVFLTLTMRGESGRSLKDTGKVLDVALRRFWQKVEVKRRIDGAVFVVQVKWNSEGRWWHVHVHALCDMDYWAQNDALEAWRSCLPQEVERRNGGVNLQLCKDRESGVGYVASYIASGFDGEGGAYSLENEELFELMEWVKGKRLMRSVGSLYGVFKEVEDDEVFKNAELVELGGQEASGGNPVDEDGNVVDLGDSDRVIWSYEEGKVIAGMALLADWFAEFYFGEGYANLDDDFDFGKKQKLPIRWS